MNRFDLSQIVIKGHTYLSLHLQNFLNRQYFQMIQNSKYVIKGTLKWFRNACVIFYDSLICCKQYQSWLHCPRGCQVVPKFLIAPFYCLRLQSFPCLESLSTRLLAKFYSSFKILLKHLFLCDPCPEKHVHLPWMYHELSTHHIDFQVSFLTRLGGPQGQTASV